MDVKQDEAKLLDDYRSLTAEGKSELLDYAAFLLKKHRSPVAEEGIAGDNQCSLGKHEERPEAAKEPIFTE